MTWSKKEPAACVEAGWRGRYARKETVQYGLGAYAVTNEELNHSAINEPHDFRHEGLDPRTLYRGVHQVLLNTINADNLA